MIIRYFQPFYSFLAILFLACFANISSSNAQQDKRFHSGLLLGLNGSQISGDAMAGFDKGGLLGGLYVSFPFTEKWSGQFEMLYTQKGSAKRFTEQDPYPGKYWNLLKIDYIEVPFLAKYNITDRWEVYAGLSAAYLMNKYLEDSYGSRDVDFIRKTDFCVYGGGSYHLTPRLSATLRYSNSILSISNGNSNLSFTGLNPINTGLINIVASFGIYYHFIPNKSSKW